MSDTPISRAQAALDQAIQQWSPAPLRSIFAEIALNDGPESYQPAGTFLRPARFALNLEDVLAPVDREAARSADGRLRQEVLTRLGAIQANAEELRLEQTLSLLHDYAWSVGYVDPSGGTDDVVSLYDYARTQAALAAAGSAALLLGGDISGVQQFIYTIAADQAARSLRGRSLYLQLLTDAFARWILREAGMPLTNLLYSGGGGFYLILPAACAAMIDDWRRKLGEFLLNVHGGELYVALGACAFQDQGATFGQTLDAVRKDLNRDKRQRFAHLDPELLMRKLFEPHTHGGNEDDRCAVCGYMGKPAHFEYASTPKSCQLCASLAELGRRLHEARFVCCASTSATLERLSGRPASKTILSALGLEFKICTSQAEVDAFVGTHEAVAIQLIRSITPAEVDDLRDRYQQHSVVSRPIVNVTPRKADGDIKSFGDLAGESVGVKRFGVLRMDVDDLGDIFSHHLKRASLGRISTLSAALSRFFEGWVGEICRSELANRQVYSVYSGGDDLFLVGSWNVLPHIAQRIQHDLRRYTGGNELVHLSGGLTLHSEKFPLYQAAKAAHEALDQAKDAPEREGHHKNALRFLDQTIGWEYSPALLDLHDELLALVRGEHPAARSLLHTLMELYGQYLKGAKRAKDKRGRDQFFFGPWIWRGMYQLTRVAEGYGKKSAEYVTIKRLRDDLVAKTDHAPLLTARRIEQAGLAARWVQLLIRQKGERNGGN